MISPKIEDRIALLLAIKEEGRGVTIEHILEKVGRDHRFTTRQEVNEEEVKQALARLVTEGYISYNNGQYIANKSIDNYVLNLREKFWELLNKSYRLVWLAKNYYPKVAKLMLPFLIDRPVTVVKIFSGKSDPIHEIDAIFSRYKKYKPRPQFNLISSEKTLMDYVYDHCIDFIPYVHKQGTNFPDWLVLDLDAGEEILSKANGIQFVKEVTLELYELLSEKGIEPLIKFSGSRGYQFWIRLRQDGFAKDAFVYCREYAMRIQSELEERLRLRMNELKQRYPELVVANEAITTSTVVRKNERGGMILVDWSSMKPQGDVRAPFSIHYKTGLVSLPVAPHEILAFNPAKDADPINLLNKVGYMKEITLKEYALNELG